jgi:nitrite reductase/ring-hydroxylating ferredoxin subunit
MPELVPAPEPSVSASDKMATTANTANTTTGHAPASATSVLPLRLCASQELAERGRAHVFDVRLWHQPARAFALRFDGRVVAYLNRCAHVPVEMDWQPGEFLCDERRWIVCSMHGAAYEPASGYCVSGPCRGRQLLTLAVHEADGQVFWTPGGEVWPPLVPAQAASLPAAGASAGPPTVSAAACPPPRQA